MTGQDELSAVLDAKRATPEYRAAYRAAQLAHELGCQIRANRTVRGWSQSDLARRAGLRQHAVSRLEMGDVVPTLTTLERIAEALGTGLSVSLAALSAQRQGVSRDRGGLDEGRGAGAA